MSRRLAYCAAFAAASAVASPALADPTPRVGIVVALGVNVTDDEAEGLAVALGDSLGDALVVDVVAGPEVARRLPAGGVPEDCVARPECIHDLGTRLDANQLLLLVIARVGSRVQIDTTWVDVVSGRASPRDAVLLEDGGAAPAKAFTDAARRLLPDALPRLTPEPGTEIARPGAVDVPPVVMIRRRHLTTPVLVAGSIGVASLIGGVTFGILAQGDYKSLDDAGCKQVQCDESDIQRLENRALYADVLYIGAAAAGATALVLYLTSGRDEPAPVTVTARPGGATVSWGGSF